MKQSLFIQLLSVWLVVGTLFCHASPLFGAISRSAASQQGLEITAVPDQVYKLGDGGKLSTESWMFFLVLTDKQDRPAPRLIESKAELIANNIVVQTIILPEAMTAKMRLKTFTVPPSAPAHSLTRAYARHETFDVPYFFPQVFTSWNVDRVRITWRLAFTDKTETTLVKEVPVAVYQQKTKLIFPIIGPGIITQGMWNNGGHSGYGNQFALDINGLTPNYAAMMRDSEDLNAYATWGREVIAPGDGKVVYMRNDVPDNPPGADPESIFSKLPEPMLAGAGNAIVISHGNSEFSVLMHMQKGSVRVTSGQSVKAGDVVGLIGSSGDSFGPHLHFQVQTGPELFRYSSVPVNFENLKRVNLLRGSYFDAKSPLQSK